MLSGKGNENSEKTTIGVNKQKNNFAHAAHFFCTFLCRCFAQPQSETSRNFLVTRFMEEMPYLLLFTFFHSLIFTLVAVRISHVLTAAKKMFTLFFQQLAPYLLPGLKRKIKRLLTVYIMSNLLNVSISTFSNFCNIFAI